MSKVTTSFAAKPSMPPVMVIVGPTASGKTGLAVELAKLVNGVVINCDSMQLYAEVPTLTAQPTVAEQENIPHHLFGQLPGSDHGNVARYLELARPTIQRVQQAGQTPILCGGTGMYLKALFEGLATIPPIPAILHEVAVAMHRDIGGAALRAKLMTVDPVLAERLNDGDTQRLIRGWEVWQATGTPLSTWQRETHDASQIITDWRALVLMPPRDKLYDKINRRFEAMMAAGAVAETQALLAKNYPLDLPVMRAHGVPELTKLINGKWTEAQAIAHSQQVTRNYAKRQYTWFNNQLLMKYPQQCRRLDCFGGDPAAVEAVHDLAQQVAR